MPYQNNLPGILISDYSYIDQTIYSNQGQLQKFTLNTTGITVTQFQNYGLLINGSLVTFVYTGSGGLNDFTAQLSNFLNEFGFFWAVVQNTPANQIELTARLVGTQYTLDKGLNMGSATITQTQTGISPVPLTPGSLLFYDIRKDSLPQIQNDHKFVTTYDQVSGVAGFNIHRHCAGILLAEESNDGISNLITNSKLRVLRSGEISYRNYGSLTNRTTTLTLNGLAPTQLLPGGSLGGGLSVSLGSLADQLFPTSYTVTGAIGTIRISL